MSKVYVITVNTFTLLIKGIFLMVAGRLVLFPKKFPI